MDYDVRFICTYCGHRFVRAIAPWNDKKVKCPNCGDKNLKEDKYSDESKDAFGYNYKDKE